MAKKNAGRIMYDLAKESEIIKGKGKGNANDGIKVMKTKAGLLGAAITAIAWGVSALIKKK